MTAFFPATQAVPSPARSDTHKTRTILILLFAGFIVNGVVTVLIGPILPVLIARWSLNDSQAGLFFSTQFAGSLGGTIIGTALTARLGYRPAIAIGYGLMGLGVAGLTSAHQVGALAATATFGAGYGLLTPGSNLYIAEAAGAKRASLLNLLNFTWGIGAVASPALVLAALKQNHLSTFLYVVTAACGAVTLALLLVPWHDPLHRKARESEQNGIGRVAPAIAIALGALFFIYVGTETSMGGWAAAFSKRLNSGSGKIYTIVPMFFWAGLLVGRGTAPVLLRYVRENRMVIGGLSLAATGMIILQFAQTQGWIMLGVTLGGLGLASIYPIYVGWLSHWYGARARNVGGIMFSLAALGGAVEPWAVGFVSSHSGNLRNGLLVPLASAIIMITIVTSLRRQIHR